jgi:hypothetical protein
LTRSIAMTRLHDEQGRKTRKAAVMSRPSSKLLFAEIQKVMAGVQKHLAGKTLVLANTTITAEAFVAALAAKTVQLSGIENARQAWLAQSKAFDDAYADEMEPQLLALRQLVQSTFGMSGSELVDFGMKPRPTRKRTAKQVVATADKAAATRTARHTVGPRQKAAIHGTVTAPEPTPPAPTGAPDAKPRG